MKLKLLLQMYANGETIPKEENKSEIKKTTRSKKKKKLKSIKNLNQRL